MTKKNERCSRCKKGKSIHRVHYGGWKQMETKEFSDLCQKCFGEWQELWKNAFSSKLIMKTTITCEKILLLWFDFFDDKVKEKVMFT